MRNAPMKLEEVQGRARMIIESGYFKDVKEMAQACVKIMAGNELGIPPVAAMRGIDIVEGQISIRAHLMAAMIKSSGKYDYEVLESTNTSCMIEFFVTNDSGWSPMGRYEFTMEDAKLAGLANRGPWKQYPKIMLYNRCMSMGAKMYCPDIFLGAIYEEGEIEVKPPMPEFKGVYENLTNNASEESYQQVRDAHGPDNLPSSWTPTGEAMQNLFGIETPVEEKLQDDDIPEHDKATTKQFGYLCGELKKKGVLDGDKTNLVDVVLGTSLTKTAISEILDMMLGTDRLPVAWFNPYIKILRERHKVTQQKVVQYLKIVYHTDKTNGLSHDQQVKLIQWVINDDVEIPHDDIPEPVTTEEKPTKRIAADLTEIEKEIVLMVDDLSLKSGIPHEFVASYLMARCNPVISDIIDMEEFDFKRFSKADRLILIKGIEKAFDVRNAESEV